MFTRSGRTLISVAGPLTLFAAPLFVIYFSCAGVLIQHSEGFVRIVLLFGGTVGFIGVVKALTCCIIRVPYNRVYILEHINTQRWVALLTGYHLFYIPGIYLIRARASAWQAEKHRELPNVTVLGGPQLNLKLDYTLRPDLPRGYQRLPRRHADAAVIEHDRRVIGLLYVMTVLPHVWEVKHGTALDGALRAFFSNRRIEQLYDPVTGAVSPSAELCAQLNEALDTRTGAWGYQVRITGVQIMGMEVQANMAWRNRLLQEILPDIARLSPEQALATAAFFGRIAGVELSRAVVAQHLHTRVDQLPLVEADDQSLRTPRSRDRLQDNL